MSFSKIYLSALLKASCLQVTFVYLLIGSVISPRYICLSTLGSVIIQDIFICPFKSVISPSYICLSAHWERHFSQIYLFIHPWKCHFSKLYLFICSLEASFLPDISVYPPFGSDIAPAYIYLASFLQDKFVYPPFGSVISSRCMYICLSAHWKSHFSKKDLFMCPLKTSLFQDIFVYLPCGSVNYPKYIKIVTHCNTLKLC